MKKMKIIDVSKVIKTPEVYYNESLMSIYHDEYLPLEEGEDPKDYVGYWPVRR